MERKSQEVLIAFTQMLGIKALTDKQRKEAFKELFDFYCTVALPSYSTDEEFFEQAETKNYLKILNEWPE